MSANRTSANRSATVRIAVALAVPVSLALAVVAPLAFAQEPGSRGYEAEPTAQAAPCCRFVSYYLWPSEPQTYRCCVRQEPEVTLEGVGRSAAAASAPSANDRAVVLPGASGPRLQRRTSPPTCVNLAELTPLERLLGQTAFQGTCVEFVAYEHFPCQCETLCNDATWSCNCPGVPLGQLPEIRPQNSLFSEPEHLGTTCIPCGAKSTCSGETPPPGDSPF